MKSARDGATTTASLHPATPTTTTISSSPRPFSAIFQPAMTNTDAKMQLAIAAVSAGGMSVREAARRYGVPRTTLQRKLCKDAAGGHHGGSGAGSRSNSITSPGASGGGGGGSDSASPTSSNHEYTASMHATPSRASAVAAATTPNSIAAAISSAIDANQSTMNMILGLYESNGNGTTPLATSSSMSRKRPADAMNAPEKQQPVSKGAQKSEVVCLLVCMFTLISLTRVYVHIVFVRQFPNRSTQSHQL